MFSSVKRRYVHLFACESYSASVSECLAFFDQANAIKSKINEKMNESDDVEIGLKLSIMYLLMADYILMQRFTYVTTKTKQKKYQISAKSLNNFSY